MKEKLTGEITNKRKFKEEEGSKIAELISEFMKNKVNKEDIVAKNK